MSTSNAVAGPSNPRKRSARERESRITNGKAPIESFGKLELAQDEEDAVNGVDQDYSTDEDDEDALFPEIDAASSDENRDSDDEADEDDEELSEDEQILRELAEEEELERDLQETSDSSFSDDEDFDPDAPDALDQAIRKATRKPQEAFGGDEVDEDYLADRDRLAGLDSRSYRNKASIGTSALTGQERWTWKDIEPGWESDEGAEEGPNRVGKIPDYFYQGMPHVGYDISGKKLLRPAKGDELDKFLSTIDDPTSWTSVEDKALAKNVQLTDEELDLIQRLAKAENPDATYDPYAPTVEWFTGKGREMATPLTSAPEPKRRFIPSKWEHKKVMKIVRAIRQGRITVKGPKAPEKPEVYAIWSEADDPLNQNHPMHMPAPKLKLPGHEESYNPPAEYLFTKDERKEWEATDTSDRKLDFMPEKHDSLRKVPGYDNFVQERFDRQLDLYLAPRSKKRKPKILEGVTKPEDLLPKLPDPSELRPFPTFCAVVYVHPGNVRVRCVSVDVTGAWVLTGADDGCARLWDCRRGKCIKTWRLSSSAPIQSVEWCPDRSGDRGSLFAVAMAGRVVIGAPLDLLADQQRADLLHYAHAGFSLPAESTTPVEGVKWARGGTAASKAEAAAATTTIVDEDGEDAVLEHNGILLDIEVPGTPKQVTWHKRGDYLVSVAPDAVGGTAVLMHQITKHSTQAPFRRMKGQVQRVMFHPTRSHLFVALEKAVRVYDLTAQTLTRTLIPGVRHVSSLDIHPAGENVLVGSYDRRVVWHDLELSDRPYRTLRYHPRAVRQTAFSTRWPLFLSTSDDGTVQIFHSTVYSDLVTNPLIVPLKVLRGHAIIEGLGVLDAKFHPKEPWIVSAGADGTARLWM